jgi:ligand-binding sensor domain-containing protein
MKNLSILKYFLIIQGLLFLLFISGCKKPEYNLLDPTSAGKWTSYNTGNSSLPGNFIYSLTKDASNNLWATCYGQGVAEYQDGVWTTYNISNSLILSNYTTAVETTSSGDVLIGTGNGLSLKSADGTWYQYKDASVTYMSINTIKISSTGDIWIGTEGQGYYYFGGSGFEHYMNGMNINAITEDGYGNILFGTDNGLYRYTGTQLSTSSVPILTKANGLPTNKITSLLVDSKARLWMGFYYGKTVTCQEGSQLHQISLMDGADSTIVWDMKEDKKGDIWFATADKGMIRYDGVVSHSYKTYNYPGDIPENNFTSICEDKDGNMWFGTLNSGILKYTLPLE